MPSFTRRAVGRSLFQVRVALLDICAQNLPDPCRSLEVVDSLLYVVGQINWPPPLKAFLRNLAVNAGLEDCVERQVRIGVRRHGPNFGPHGAMVTDGHAHHGAAVCSRGANLVWRFKVRVEAAIRVDAGVEDKAEIERAVQNAVKERPAECG